MHIIWNVKNWLKKKYLSIFIEIYSNRINRICSMVCYLLAAGTWPLGNTNKDTLFKKIYYTFFTIVHENAIYIYTNVKFIIDTAPVMHQAET